MFVDDIDELVEEEGGVLDEDGAVLDGAVLDGAVLDGEVLDGYCEVLDDGVDDEDGLEDVLWSDELA